MKTGNMGNVKDGWLAGWLDQDLTLRPDLVSGVECGVLRSCNSFLLICLLCPLSNMLLFFFFFLKNREEIRRLYVINRVKDLEFYRKVKYSS